MSRYNHLISIKSPKNDKKMTGNTLYRPHSHFLHEKEDFFMPIAKKLDKSPYFLHILTK